MITLCFISAALTADAVDAAAIKPDTNKPIALLVTITFRKIGYLLSYRDVFSLKEQYIDLQMMNAKSQIFSIRIRNDVRPSIQSLLFELDLGHLAESVQVSVQLRDRDFSDHLP